MAHGLEHLGLGLGLGLEEGEDGLLMIKQTVGEAAGKAAIRVNQVRVGVRPLVQSGPLCRCLVHVGILDDLHDQGAARLEEQVRLA